MQLKTEEADEALDITENKTLIPSQAFSSWNIA